MTDEEKELRAIIIRVQGKQYDDEETLHIVAERAYRLGREMRAASEKAAPPEPRKPVAGWEYHGADARLRTAVGMLEAMPDGMYIHPSGRATSIVAVAPEGTLEAAQLAAEDALFAIADAINALRGRQ